MGDLTKIGALWLRSGAKGKFMSGTLELEGRNGAKVSILVFKNTRKTEGDKRPDYEVFQAEDRPQRSQPDEDEGL